MNWTAYDKNTQKEKSKQDLIKKPTLTLFSFRGESGENSEGEDKSWIGINVFVSI